MDASEISASAMSAQRLRLDVIASNLANVNTTRQSDGSRGAYHRRNVVFAPLLQNELNSGGGSAFASTLPLKPPSSENLGASISMQDGRVVLKTGIGRTASYDGAGVEVTNVAEDNTTPMKQIYDPSHPDADKDGYVEMPNINPVSEMVDMISATRAYEANVSAFQASKSIGKAALEI